MLNRIFKTKFDPATGLSYAVSEIGKSHNTKNLSLTTLGAVLLSTVALSGNANAVCPSDTDRYISQIGGTCTYERDMIADDHNQFALIDLKASDTEGATATFNAQNITLKKVNLGKASGSYAAIYLQRDDKFSNQATFNNDVTVLPAGQRHVRDIIVGGGSKLFINGNLTMNHSNKGGGLFALHSNESGWHNDRTDTTMVINGNFTGTSQSGYFIALGTGDFTFAKDVNLTAPYNGGSIWSQENSAGKLTFKGETTIQNEGTFLNPVKNSTPTITFNKFTITNNSTENIFRLEGGTTSILGDGTFNTPNAAAINIYGGAIFENGGVLSITDRNGGTILARSSVGEPPATFHNLATGVVENDNSVILNGKNGTLIINNEGVLSSTSEAIFRSKPYASNEISAINTGTLNGFLNSDADTLTLINETGGVWNNTKDSSLDSLTNKGTINFVAPADKSHLTISTDKYTGGGTLVMNTIWNDDGTALNGTSSTDKLKIKTVEGSDVTTVKVVGNKLGTITPKDKAQFSVDVIEVENAHNGNLFVGTAETNSPQEAQLMKEGNNYRWTLQAKLTDKPTTPTNPTTPTVPTPTVDIISKPVVGYVQQPFINRQMGFDQLGKLHERVGEQRNAGWENGNAINQVWGRMNLDYTALQGRERFGADVKSGFVQFGRDIDFKLNDDKSQQHTGLTFTYGWANSKFFDKYKAENGVVVADKFTGSAKSDMLSIGGYHTYYSPTGAYIDLVGQASWLQNRYRSGNSQVKQNGYGLGASIEVGKPFPLLNPQVTVEPQAQLSYQSIWLNGFNDGIRQVKKSRQDSLVGRLGVRVNWSETLDKNSPQVYFTANLMQTLTGKGSTIQVGREQVKERFGDLAAEFGVGVQYPVNQNLSLYADARYVIGIQDRNRVHRDSSLSRRSYHGRIGLRYSW